MNHKKNMIRALILAAVVVMAVVSFTGKSDQSLKKMNSQEESHFVVTPTENEIPEAIKIPETTETPKDECVENKELPSSYMIEDVPHIVQYPEFSNGCEAVAATVALNYVGIDITVEEFVDEYLPISYYQNDEEGRIVAPSMDEAFIGDPRSSSGAGCHPKCILYCFQEILKDQQLTDEYEMHDATGSTLEELCQYYVIEDVPVIFWATIGMADIADSSSWYVEGTDELETFYLWDHCLVLTGYDENFYYFSDSISGDDVTPYEKSDVEHAYEMTGSFAAVIMHRK